MIVVIVQRNMVLFDKDEGCEIAMLMLVTVMIMAMVVTMVMLAVAVY